MSSKIDFSAGTEVARIGARVTPNGTSYVVWAPDHAGMTVNVTRGDGRTTQLTMEPRANGYFSVDDPEGRAGDRYGFLLPDGTVLPDPASRFQPEGVHGLSECVDGSTYEWRSTDWTRPGWHGQSIYELHVGTFTEQGTFRAAIKRLDHLVSLGVGAIEIMPVADFPGKRNWGYDGVCLFAPARCYGRPDDLRALVDAAHARGIAVILDVVYNHLGPDGNYLSRFAKRYFDPERHTPWGQAFNLSGGDESKPVRDYFLANACYWLDEFRIDGLRLDATHAIVDDSPRHLLADIAAAAHRRGAFLIAEDERNTCEILHRPDGSGCGIDAMWADDFHHQVRVALTGVQESYFKSYRGSAQDIATTLEHGWFFRGQSFAQWKGRPRGEPCAHLPPKTFVMCIENHDQAGNRARGERLAHLISASAYRAASALLCLAPYPPMIFMGQEWAASTPFLFFTDHAGELGQKVSEGRQKEFTTAGLNQGIAPEDVPDPQLASTFKASKLRWDELRQSPHASVVELYRQCLRHRAEWLQAAASDRANWSAAALERAVAVRYHSKDQPERLVISSLTGETRLSLQDELLRPPSGCVWRIEFESNAATADVSKTTAALSASTVSKSGVDALVLDVPTTVLLVAMPKSS